MVCGRRITLAAIQFSLFLFLFLILQFRQFNCHHSVYLFIFGNIIVEIPFSLPHPSHHSLFSLPLFFNILAMVLSKFVSLLIFPNKFEQYHITNKLHFLQYSAKRLILLYLIDCLSVFFFFPYFCVWIFFLIKKIIIWQSLLVFYLKKCWIYNNEIINMPIKIQLFIYHAFYLITQLKF